MFTVDLLIYNEFTLRLIKNYAPNQDQPDLFEEIQELVESNVQDYLIICGNLNFVLDQQLDSF